MKRVGHISEFYKETLVIMAKRLRHLFAASSMQNANFKHHVAENVTERVRAVNKPNKQRADETSCLCSDSRYAFDKCLCLCGSEFSLWLCTGFAVSEGVSVPIEWRFGVVHFYRRKYRNEFFMGSNLYECQRK